MVFGMMESSWKPSDMRDLSTWSIMVTGGTSGLGLAATKEFLKKGATVYTLSENLEQGKTALQQLKAEVPENQKAEFFQVDLSDFEAVKKFADSFKSLNKPLHVLINNAGVSIPAEKEAPNTVNGIEKQLATNVYGPLLLTHYLLPVLKSNTPARIVFMASPSETAGTIPDDLKKSVTADVNSFPNYGSTNVLRLALTKVFAEHLKGTGVTVFACQPGQSNTPIFDKTDKTTPTGAMMGVLRTVGGAQDPSQGALSMMYAATAQGLDENTGAYFGPWYGSAGISTNTGNTTEREPLNKDLEDYGKLEQTYKKLVTILEEATGEEVPNKIIRNVEA